MGTLNGDSDIYFTYAYDASSSRVLCTNVEIVFSELLGGPSEMVPCCQHFLERRDWAIVEISATVTAVVGADEQHLNVNACGMTAKTRLLVAENDLVMRPQQEHRAEWGEGRDHLDRAKQEQVLRQLARDLRM